ncbi:hypothetical protein diail_5048 [Diaporthe ilicicola]|nr:hypothetical protein diail_5048 [Diaporthe ilicicola]
MALTALLLAAAVLPVLSLLVKSGLSTLKAIRSPLRDIPGPWYAPLTTVHLKWGFSTGEIWKTVEKAHVKYGTIVRLGPRQIWVSDKEALKQILVKVDLPKVAMYSEISRDKLSPGLFGEIRYEPHKKLKRFLSPAFTVNYIDNLESYFQDTVRALLSKYQNDIENDFQVAKNTGFQADLMDDLHNVALDMQVQPKLQADDMGECSFGKGFGQTNPALTEVENGVDERVWKSIPRSIFDGLAKRYQTVYVKKFFRQLGWDIKFDWPAEMITAIDAVVRRRSANRDVAERQDLLQHMIEKGRRPDTGGAMASRDIIDQMAEVLLAGSETTSGTIACLFLELARNPDVRAKLLASLPARPVLGDDDIITSKTVRTDPQYEYLEACIKENLRIHPIASEMGRRTGNEWVEIMGYRLPPHTVVSASYRALHLNEQHWPQAQRFWPERWLPEGKRGDAPAPDMDAYYPFSGGKHSCIGINFAWAEMRMVAANIFSRFDVLEVPGQDIDFRQYITMQFASGHWKVKLKPRQLKF